MVFVEGVGVDPIGIEAPGPAPVSQLVKVGDLQEHALAGAEGVLDILSYHLDDLAPFAPRQPEARVRQQGFLALSIRDGERAFFIKPDGNDAVAQATFLVGDWLRRCEASKGKPKG